MSLSRASVFLVLAIPAFAQDSPPLPPIPSYFVIAPQAQLKPNYNFEIYGETEFAILHGNPVIQRGKHWAAALTVSGVPDGVEPDDVWVRQVKPTLVDAGWKFFAEEHGQAKSARYQKDGHDTWLMLWAFGNDDMRFDLIEVGPCPVSVKLPKPAESPKPSAPIPAISRSCRPFLVPR